MKKISRIFSLIFVAAFAFIGVTRVNAYDTTVTFSKRQLSNVEQYKVAQTSYKEVGTSAGNRVAYCFNKSLKAPTNGSKLTYNGEVTSAPLIYILTNGYGGTWNSALLGNSLSSDQKYYVTQLAIWMTQGTLSPSSLNANGTLGKPALALYNAARAYSVVKPSISSSTGGSMTLTSDGAYYQSQEITVGGTGYNQATVLLINAPSSARIRVNGGQLQGNNSKVNRGSKIRVLIPVADAGRGLNIKVRISSTGYQNKIYTYTSGNSTYQNVGLMFNEAVPVSTETATTVNPKRLVEIRKYDVSTGSKNLLSGVTLSLKNSSGAEILRWTTNSTNNPYKIQLSPGTYTVTEISAPAGFVKASPITFTVSSGSTTLPVELLNSKTPSKVTISKQDFTTKAELPGAHLVLKDSLGNKVDEWTSTTTPHILNNLKPGKYTLSETIAPNGYVLSTETVTFTVNNDGSTLPVVMYNNKKPDNSYVKISKKDIETGKMLPGAKLVVKDSTGKVIDEWVSTTKAHFIYNLKEGKYTLVETKAPKGYEIGDEVIEFEIKADGGKEISLVMHNSKIPVTADMNITLIVAGLVGTIAIAGFSVFKLGQQQA